MPTTQLKAQSYQAQDLNQPSPLLSGGHFYDAPSSHAKAIVVLGYQSIGPGVGNLNVHLEGACITTLMHGSKQKLTPKRPNVDGATGENIDRGKKHNTTLGPCGDFQKQEDIPGTCRLSISFHAVKAYISLISKNPVNVRGIPQKASTSHHSKPSSSFPQEPPAK
ncbi:hypothetical protein VNO77_22651 [Canavalia gladiata]|uniref:Uncharacterized protein n=1 Tax=Canavalia gladiata TaxID=3824 RepID=A0AAN9L4F1_CANGL